MHRFQKRKRNPTQLSWEEKNPSDYVYRPSKAMKRLRKKLKEKGEKNGKRTKVSKKS